MTNFEYWYNQKNKYIGLAICSEARGELGKALRYSETAKACKLIIEKLTIEEASQPVNV